MAVNMLTKDPYAAEEMQALRYSTSPSAPREPTVMDGVKNQLAEKGIDMAMEAATDAAIAGAAKMTGSTVGGAVGGPAGAAIGSYVAPGLYEGALKPLFEKLFFDRGGVVGGPLSAKHLRKAQEERFASADKNSMAQLAANEAATEDPSFLDRAVDFISGLMDKRKANNRLVNQGFFMRPSLMPEYYDNGGMVGGPLSPMMTNVSKVRYKQSGGKVAEEIELNYHGPLASKGG